MVKKQVLSRIAAAGCAVESPTTKDQGLIISVRQVADETTNTLVSLCCLFVDLVELLLCDVDLIQSCVKLTFHFRAGPLSVAKKSDELRIAAPIKAFGNVVGKGVRNQ